MNNLISIFMIVGIILGGKLSTLDMNNYLSVETEKLQILEQQTSEKENKDLEFYLEKYVRGIKTDQQLIDQINQRHNEIYPSITHDLGKIYSIALDSLMALDPALNHDMKYIAINTNTLKDVDTQAKTNVLKYFSKYNVQVIDESHESLKNKGMVGKGGVIEGVLLEIDDITCLSDKKLLVEGSKFKSGLGAISAVCIVVYENDEWKVAESKINSIS